MLAEKLQVDCYYDRLKLLERGLSDGKRFKELFPTQNVSCVLTQRNFCPLKEKTKTMVLWEKT